MVTSQSPAAAKSAPLPTVSAPKDLPTAPFTDGKPTPDTKLVDATAYEAAAKTAADKQAIADLDAKRAADAAVHTKSLAELLEEHFVRTDDLRKTSSNFPWRGRCEKCGWHTHQFDKDAALALTRLHVQSHWRDVSRFM